MGGGGGGGGGGGERTQIRNPRTFSYEIFTGTINTSETRPAQQK
jgi:hypothetical protein